MPCDEGNSESAIKECGDAFLSERDKKAFLGPQKHCSELRRKSEVEEQEVVACLDPVSIGVPRKYRSRAPNGEGPLLNV